MRYELRSSTVRWMSLALAATLVTGCGVELEGEEGNLTFEYVDDGWRSLPASGDLAAGANVDIQVTDARVEDGETEPLELTDAYSDDAQTMEVVDRQTREFQLQAHEESPPEGTRIHADAVDDKGEDVSDAVSIRSAEVDSVEIDSMCEDALYVTDSEARFNYDMLDAGGDRLTGYGYYPVSVDSEDGGSIVEDHTRLQTLAVQTGSTPGEYQIVTGDEVDGEAADFELIEPADISELDLNTEHEDSDSTVEVDTESIGAIFGLGVSDDALLGGGGDDSNVVCGGADGAVELNTTTPDVCNVSYGFFGSLHGVNVEGLEAGTCEIELGIADTDLEESFSVTIE